MVSELLYLGNKGKGNVFCLIACFEFIRRNTFFHKELSNRSSYFLNYAPRPYICSLGQLSRKLLPSGSWSSQYSERIQALLYPLLPQRLLVLSHSSVKFCETGIHSVHKDHSRHFKTIQLNLNLFL